MWEWGEYIVKVNLALTVFYLMYRYIFRNDTFFELKRFFLLAVYLIAFLYPLADLSAWMARQEFVSALVGLYKTLLLPSWEAAGPVVNPALAPGPATLAGVHAPAWHGAEIAWSVVCGIYLTGVALLLTRRSIELGGLAKLLAKCRKTRLAGRRVYLFRGAEEPFSFFGFVFINPDRFDTEDTEKIVLHESIHAEQLHSFDVLAAELAKIICWFNPFVWLLKREMMLNHEFLTDRTVVVKGGVDRKAYQYCLIGKSFNSSEAAADLYNHFSVLLLKKRIVMLNKKRTRRIGQLSYLMFVLMAGVLLLASNVDAAARTTAEEAPAPGPVVLPAGFPATAAQKDSVTPAQKKSAQTDDLVFTIVERMPELSTGMKVEKFIARNMKYPPAAIEEKLEGSVAVKFIVNTDGTVSDVKVVRSVAPVLDAEAVRVIESLPKFIPGSQRGKKVRVAMAYQVNFELAKNKSAETRPDDGKK